MRAVTLACQQYALRALRSRRPSRRRTASPPAASRLLLFSTKRCWRFPPEPPQRVQRSHISSTKQKALQRAIPSQYYAQPPGRRPREHADRRPTISAAPVPKVRPMIVATVERRNRPREVRHEDVVQRTRRAVERPPAEQWAQREGDLCGKVSRGAPDNSSLSHLSAMTRPSWFGRTEASSPRHRAGVANAP